MGRAMHDRARRTKRCNAVRCDSIVVRGSGPCVGGSESLRMVFAIRRESGTYFPISFRSDRHLIASAARRQSSSLLGKICQKVEWNRRS